jgi:hypothetical protein
MSRLLDNGLRTGTVAVANRADVTVRDLGTSQPKSEPGYQAKQPTGFDLIPYPCNQKFGSSRFTQRFVTPSSQLHFQVNEP